MKLLWSHLNVRFGVSLQPNSNRNFTGLTHIAQKNPLLSLHISLLKGRGGRAAILELSQ